MRIAAAVLLIAALLAAPVRAANRITIDVRDADLSEVIALLAAESGMNVVADVSMKPEKITLHLHDVTFEDALAVLVKARDLEIRRQDGIVIVGSRDSMDRRYGDASETAAGSTAVLRLRRADPAEVAKEIEPGLPEGTLIVPDKRTGAIVVAGNDETLARAKTLVAALDAPRFQRDSNLAQVYRLRYVKPSEMLQRLKGSLPDGSAVADDAQNAIVVTGNEGLQRSAAALFRSMDVAGPQVLFEVRVADVEPVNDQSDVGVEFGGYDLTNQPISGAATYAFAGNSIAINARLNALVSQGHAEILATPKLLTVNNKEADLLIGQTYPVVYYDARYGGQQVQFVDVGVKLRLTPTIGADGSVTAEMHPEYSAIEGFVGGYPVIANRKADSTLRVKDNQTIVLGGLLRDVRSESITKVPGLSSIPIIGKLFTNRAKTHQRDEVVFLITPHVIYADTPAPAR